MPATPEPAASLRLPEPASDPTRPGDRPASRIAPTVLVRRLRAEARLPSYAHPGDAGADVCAAEDATLAPGERVLIPTGLALAIPRGYAALVHPRSGLALRHGLTLLNTPGTIDAGYRGELRILMVNLDPATTAVIRAGDRIAQLVVQRVEEAGFVAVDHLPTGDVGIDGAPLVREGMIDLAGGSPRGTGGFGSTGGFGAAVPTIAHEEMH